MITISVIIPTYNRIKMVKRAIDSVLNQTLQPMQIIVVDDGSTDNTESLFPIEGVEYYQIPHSGYPGKVRNFGVSKANSDYIAFLDSDDFWSEEKLEMQEAYLLSNPQCTVVHTKELWLMNGKKVSQKKRKHKKEGDIFKESLQGCIMGPSTVVIKKDIFNSLDGFPENIEVGEDYYLWLKVCNKNYIGYIDKELITKNAGHSDQLSFKYGYIEPFKVEVLENLLLKGIFNKENQLLAIESLNNKYEIIINGCKKRNNNQEANKYIERQCAFNQKLKKIEDKYEG